MIVHLLDAKIPIHVFEFCIKIKLRIAVALTIKYIFVEVQSHRKDVWHVSQQEECKPFPNHF